MSPKAATAATPQQVVTVPAADLKDASAWAARTLPLRPPVPILAGMMLTPTDGVLTIAAFDFQAHATINVDVDGGWDGPVLVSGRLLAEIAGRLTGEATLTLTDSLLTVKAGRQSFRLGLMQADLYPQTPASATTTGEVDADELAELVGRASAAVSRKVIEDLPLHLLHVKAGDGGLTAWGTDRYRAAQVSLPWAGDDFEVLVSAVSITSALRGMTGPIRLGANDNHLTVEARDRTATISREALNPTGIARLMADSTFAPGFHVDRHELAEALASARLTVEANKPVILRLGDDELEVSSEADQAGTVATLDVVSETAITWGVNGEFLAELIGAAPGPRVLIEPATGDRAEAKPMRIRGADTEGNPIDGATFMLVPIRLNR